VAVADVAGDRARQVADELEIENSFGSLEAMLECRGLDAVVIATPERLHTAAVKMAAAAGKDILCEKPLALTLAEAHELLRAVSKTGVRLQVGFMRRYDPAYAAAMKRIEAGEIGVPVIFKSLGRDKDGPSLSAYQTNVNGMLFYTNSIHDFDLARWLMRDEVCEVHAYTTSTIRPEVAQFGDVVERRQPQIRSGRDWQHRVARSGNLRVRRAHGNCRFKRLDPDWELQSNACDSPYCPREHSAYR
jgi:predicted dehydrogenase